LESGGRMVDAILTNNVLQATSQEFLNRMVEGKPVSRVRIQVLEGDFGFTFE
jgi:type VI secretion system protein VasG